MNNEGLKLLKLYQTILTFTAVKVKLFVEVGFKGIDQQIQSSSVLPFFIPWNLSVHSPFTVI